MRLKRNTKMLSALVSEEFYNRVVKVTDDLQMTISDFLRNAVSKELDQYLTFNHEESMKEVTK